jgi:hypothetical protein
LTIPAQEGGADEDRDAEPAAAARCIVRLVEILRALMSRSIFFACCGPGERL